MTERRSGERRSRREEEVLQRWIKRMTIFMAIFGMCSAVALGGFGYILRQDAKERIAACEERNDRHDAAIKALVDGSDQDQRNAPNEAARKEIRRRRDVTIGIIDGIAPKVNCDKPSEPAVKTELGAP